MPAIYITESESATSNTGLKFDRIDFSHETEPAFPTQQHSPSTSGAQNI